MSTIPTRAPPAPRPAWGQYRPHRPASPRPPPSSQPPLARPDVPSLTSSHVAWAHCGRLSDGKKGTVTQNGHVSRSVCACDHGRRGDGRVHDGARAALSGAPDQQQRHRGQHAHTRRDPDGLKAPGCQRRAPNVRGAAACNTRAGRSAIPPARHSPPGRTGRAAACPWRW